MTSLDLENSGFKQSMITVEAINHNFYATFVAPMKYNSSIAIILILILSLSITSSAQELLQKTANKPNGCIMNLIILEVNFRHF
jgi:hypothetical protein